MIEARVLRRSGRIVGLVVRGHAGFAGSGQDIVCAGVTALAETAILGLTRVAGLSVRPVRASGELAFRLDPDQADDMRAQAILATAALGLTDIAKDYPDHVEILDEEV